MSRRPRAPAHRLATVWCAHWPVTTLVLAGDVAPGQPVAVVHANRVVACSRAAAHDGVRVGMRRRESQSACPSLTVVEHDAGRDSRAFEAVLRAVAELVPLLEVTTPGRLSFATRGPSRFVGGDEALAGRLQQIVTSVLGEALPATGVPGIGIADGRFAAAVAARTSLREGRPHVVPPGRAATTAFLAPVPLGALVDAGDVAPDLVGLLRRLGLHRLGEVAALPAGDLTARFGAAGRVLHRLATGTDDTPPASAPPPLDLTVTEVFDDPVGQLQALVFSAKSLADVLAADLTRRGLVCTRLLVEAEADDGRRTSRCWYRPVGLSAAAMVERVRWQLEGWAHGDATAGGVVLLRLTPDEVAADDGVQAGFWGGRTEADEWAGRAVARLSGLLGPEAVTVAEWRGGRDPGRTFALVPASTADLADRAARVVAGTEPWPGRLPAPSPVCVHPVPVEVALLDASGQVVRVSGRGALSASPARLVTAEGTAQVVGWAGPWPVEERWWQAGAGSRSRRAARFQVMVAHRRGETGAHLVELSDNRWWLVADYA